MKHQFSPGELVVHKTAPNQPFTLVSVEANDVVVVSHVNEKNQRVEQTMPAMELEVYEDPLMF